MTDPWVRTLSWVQALGDQPARMWRDGRLLPAYDTNAHMDGVAAISAITSATTRTELPGGAAAYGQGRHGQVHVVVEVPRTELDEFSRKTAVVIFAVAARQWLRPSDVARALLDELRRLQEDGVRVEPEVDPLRRAITDVVEVQLWPPLLGRLSPAGRRLRHAVEQEGTIG